MPYINGLPNLTGLSMHVDFRMGCDPALFATADACLANGFGKALNNGFEQLFIMPVMVQTPTAIPEPSVLLLMDVGLFAMRRRARR